MEADSEINEEQFEPSLSKPSNRSTWCTKNVRLQGVYLWK
jgi:hypothetical protein